jgi:hypothetical protein
MMAKLNIFFLFIIILMVNSCADTEEKPTTQVDDLEDYYEFKKFYLKNFDLNASIMLPDETANIGASMLPEVKHEYDGFKWEIQVGPNFNLIIEDWGDNRSMISVEKKRLKDLPMFKITYLIDEPDLIVYERKLIVDGSSKAPKSVGLEHLSYHVFGQKIINNYTYVFKSTDEGAEKKIIDLMAKSVKSVRQN